MNDTSQRMTEVADLQQQLAGAGYIAERSLAAALLLMLDLGRPLLLEGDAGVGKTEVAKALATVRKTRLIRLQCYEGLDAHAAMYEWNYQRQLLAIKLLEHDERRRPPRSRTSSPSATCSSARCSRRSVAQPPVLLIDEVDRADEAFEAYLLELLSDFQMSIPELGTVRAVTRPLVVMTSNGTRELSDALRRRCLYQYIDYPVVREGAGDRRDQGAAGGGTSWPARSSSSCRACAAWTCRKSPASPRRSTGRRPCCAWEFP